MFNPPQDARSESTARVTSLGSRQIANADPDSHAAAFHLSGSHRQIELVDVNEADIGALPGKRDGNCAANSGSRAGDQCPSSTKAKHQLRHSRSSVLDNDRSLVQR